MVSPLNLLDALQPNASRTLFPVPPLIQPGGITSESLSLSGINMPGQWLLVDATRVFGWQMLKCAGKSGATLLPIGDDLMTFKFAIKIWTSLDAQVYRTALKTVLRKPAFAIPGSTVSAAMGIDQPQLADLGVRAVVVKSVTPLMNPLTTSGGKGPWTATVEFWEYRKPVDAIATPSQVTPDKAPPTPTAQNAAELEIKKAAAEFAAHSSRLAQSISGGPRP